MISEITKAKITDYVFVSVESKLNNKIGSFELSLDPSLVHQGWLPSDEEGVKKFNEELHVRTSAVVIAVPEKLNERPLRENYLGTPKYAPHITHEIIKDAIEKMPPAMRNKYGRNMYYPGNPPDSYEHQPNNPEIQVGDTIHFEYNCLLADAAYVGQDRNGLVFMIPYQSIYCYVRNGKLTMINGWIFVESVTKEQITKSIVLVNNKPQPYVGKIAYASKWMDYYTPSQGANCLFVRTLFSVKNWEYVEDSHEISGYTVNGKLYYPMRNWEVVAVERYGQWETVNSFVSIKPEPINEINGVSTIVYDEKKLSQPFKKGQIFIPQGSNVQEKKRKIHNYGIGKCNGERVVYGKSNWYLYMNELDVLFLSKKDLWGKLTENIG